MKSNIDALLSGIELVPDSLQDKTPTEPESKEQTINTEESKELTTEQETSSPDYDSGESTEDNNSTSDSQELTTDDYGQPVSKKERVYTQAEVEQMMRDRNARGEFAKQEALRAAQELLAQQQGTKQPESSEDSEDWVQELKTVVKQTFNEITQEEQQKQWQAEAQRQQAEFEVKFNSGAAKYSDFESVVIGKAITPEMVIATKAMQDPAAFIYAAAKTQAPELERISKITDRFVQAVELGKLEERMRKSRVIASSAPKPIDGVKGDFTDKQIKPKNIDDILREEDAKRFKGR